MLILCWPATILSPGALCKLWESMINQLRRSRWYWMLNKNIPFLVPSLYIQNQRLWFSHHHINSHGNVRYSSSDTSITIWQVPASCFVPPQLPERLAHVSFLGFWPLPACVSCFTCCARSLSSCNSCASCCVNNHPCCRRVFLAVLRLRSCSIPCWSISFSAFNNVNWYIICNAPFANWSTASYIAVSELFWWCAIRFLIKAICDKASAGLFGVWETQGWAVLGAGVLWCRGSKSEIKHRNHTIGITWEKPSASEASLNVAFSHCNAGWDVRSPKL